MQPKSRTIVAIFFIFVISAGGCSTTPPSGAVSEPITLRVACPVGAAADVVRSHSKAWEARNNAVVEVTEYGADGPEDVGADIWLIAPAELPRWAARDRLLPVPEELRENDDAFGWKGLEPMYREYLLLWAGTAYALPVVGEAPLFCYRPDLIKDENFVKAFNARLDRKESDGRQPVVTLSTWKEVVTAAECFAAHLPPAMKGSLPPLPADDGGQELEHEFYTIAAGYVRGAVSDIRSLPQAEAFAFHYDLRKGHFKPRIAGPGFVLALKRLQQLQACRAPSGEAPVEAFRKGTGVMCLIDAADVFRLQQRDSAVRDRFAVTRMPGGEGYFAFDAVVDKGFAQQPVGGNWMPYLGHGGRLGVVPGTTSHPEEAFSLLAELAGRTVSRQVVLSPRSVPPRGGDAFRADHFDRNARWEAFDLDAPRAEVFRKAVQQTVEQPGVAAPVYRLRTPDERERRKVLIDALRAALADPKTDAATALKGVEHEWEKMDAKNPKFEDEYRLSVGLSAR
jgi:ABC-type glycerol-3-phosphate transport system substrate-binding protein